ncbi:Lrp/AsnC family transcriptional regulator [Arthrobacter sp. HY1533]|uniref:Lrp/AsnC family transcriptional regulator n=1 Tax=Arthrobacter sp. HY1533 TaxID=2970919 RepID=UPI0022BA024B|nr:AsnC family transcriptional regulator [Arthrobacter sp. HY1533]
MNQLDTLLVHQLQADGRASYSDLAKSVGSNRAMVASHVNELLASGKVKVIAAVHPRVLGLEVLAHLSVQLSGPSEPVLRGIETLDSAVYISETTGTHQVVVEIRLGTMGQLYETVAFISGLPNVSAVNVLLYERVIRSLFLGEEPVLERLSLDQTDIDIMRILQHDGRRGFAEIGEAIGVSMSTCRSRALRLLDANIMQIGAITRREGTSDAIVFGCGIALAGNASQEVVDLLAEVEGVEFVARTIGRYAMVCTIATSSQLEYNHVVARIRSLPGVRHVETWLHTRIVQERYENTLDQLETLGGR